MTSSSLREIPTVTLHRIDTHVLCAINGAAAGYGVDLALVEPAWLRRQVGVVLQENFLFDGTIAENVAYGNPGATPDQVLADARPNLDGFLQDDLGGTVSAGDYPRSGEGRITIL